MTMDCVRNTFPCGVLGPNIDDDGDGNGDDDHFAFRRNETHQVAMMFLMPHWFW